MSRYKFQEIIESSSEKRAPVPGDEKNFITMNQIRPNSLAIPAWGVTELNEDERPIIKKGDVLFIKRDPQNHQVAVSPIDGLCTGFAMVLRPQPEVIEPDFLPYFMTSDTFIGEAVRISVGTKYKTANWGELKDLEFELPEKDVQKKLVGILQKTEQIIAHYESLAKDLELAEESFYHEKILHAPASRQMPLGELMTMHKDSTRFESLENERYVTYEEIARGITSIREPKKNAFHGYRLEEGQLAAHRQNFYKNGTALVTKEFEWAVISSQTQLFDVNRSLILPEFLEYMITRKNFLNQLEKLDLSTANWNHIFSRKKISVPAIQIQKQFLSFCQKADAGLLQTQKCREQAYETLQSLLCEYVTV